MFCTLEPVSSLTFDEKIYEEKGFELLIPATLLK